MSLLSACACTLLKGCVVRALKIVRGCDGDRILLPKKGEEKPLFVVFAPGREKCFKKMHLVNSPISVLGCTKDAKRRRVIIKSCWILQYKIRSIEKKSNCMHTIHLFVAPAHDPNLKNIRERCNRGGLGDKKFHCAVRLRLLSHFFVLYALSVAKRTYIYTSSVTKHHHLIPRCLQPNRFWTVCLFFENVLNRTLSALAAAAACSCLLYTSPSPRD